MTILTLTLTVRRGIVHSYSNNASTLNSCLSWKDIYIIYSTSYNKIISAYVKSRIVEVLHLQLSRDHRSPSTIYFIEGGVAQVQTNYMLKSRCGWSKRSSTTHGLCKNDGQHTRLSQSSRRLDGQRSSDCVVRCARPPLNTLETGGLS